MSRSNRLARLVWNIIAALLYRPSPVPLHGWRRFLLRRFGARIANDALVYPSARVWAPWNLSMEEGSCLGSQVDCYSVAPIFFGARAVVSQHAHLCTASHDYTRTDFPLIAAAITIGADAWVAAGAFVGPGVQVGEGAVAAARAVVVRDVAPWTVVGGNPSRFLKKRDRPPGEKIL